MNCKKHGEVIGIPVNVHIQGDPRPPTLQFFCSKCQSEDRSEAFHAQERKKQFDELAKEAEAQEALEADVEIENLKEKMTNKIIADAEHIEIKNQEVQTNQSTSFVARNGGSILIDGLKITRPIQMDEPYDFKKRLAELTNLTDEENDR